MKLAATLTPDELARMTAALKLPVKNLVVKAGAIETEFTYAAPLVGDIDIDLEARVVPGGAS